jgi:hypothetical protein
MKHFLIMMLLVAVDERWKIVPPRYENKSKRDWRVVVAIN